MLAEASSGRELVVRFFFDKLALVLLDHRVQFLQRSTTVTACGFKSRGPYGNDLDRVIRAYSGQGIACIDRADEGVRRFHTNDIGQLSHTKQGRYAGHQILARGSRRGKNSGIVRRDIPDQGGNRFRQLVSIGCMVSA